MEPGGLMELLGLMEPLGLVASAGSDLEIRLSA
jgi:hypothetical protein